LLQVVDWQCSAWEERWVRLVIFVLSDMRRGMYGKGMKDLFVVAVASYS
jgi:hypothetical protein